MTNGNAVSIESLAANIRVGDAFVRRGPGGNSWTIGTKAVQLTYKFKYGKFTVSSFRNNLTKPAREYVSAASECAPFGVDALSSTGAFSMEELWARHLSAGTEADLALSLTVKKGALIGFSDAIRDNRNTASVSWVVTLDYGDGETYTSSDDTALNQGPIWYYYTHTAGTGYMCQKRDGITATGFRPENSFDLVRVWKAPKDGMVTVRGVAKQVDGSPASQVRVLRITENATRPATVPSGYNNWAPVSVSPKKVSVGGRPAVQLDIAAERGPLRAHLHVQAYPGTSILRQWVELENTASAPISLASASPVMLGMSEDASPLTNYWMCGGNSSPTQGQLESSSVTQTYHRTLLGEKTDNYVPWIALERQGTRDDGCFVTMDHLGAWTLGFDNSGGRSVLSSSLPQLVDYELEPGEILRLPLATMGVFHKNLDDMGRRVYDWQYEYLWDYTNSDYFARTNYTTPWFYCSRNLQEQFTARLASLDMDSDIMSEVGIEMLWDDAGWAKYPGWPVPDSYSTVFEPSSEGPDYAETLKYIGKMDMKWVIWLAHRPTQGLMDSKIGAWGNFQWRTDSFGKFNIKDHLMFCARIEHFLNANPHASFHTCDGGSRYAHQFEIQRYADVNYLSDIGRDAKTNHYLSYLEVPDKWLDIIDTAMQGSKYVPDTAARQLTMVPNWYGPIFQKDRESVRRLVETYRYLRREGVVGRWSHMMHPLVKGDTDYYYDQRTSRDRKKACIICKHKPEANSTVYPQGLLSDYNYTVGLESVKETTVRTGADLMSNGIALGTEPTGGVIYLGLPYVPGAGHDTCAPTAPGRVLARRETNLGHSGVALYWSPGSDKNWVSYYEVRRNLDVIGKSSIATYYFDHSIGWNETADYAVRTVDGDGNASDWTTVEMIIGGEDIYATLGGHFAKSGRDGWSAETSADGSTFAPMAFIPPAKNPAADFAGTPNQPGGVEGYWEGPGGARIGRGWQQASTDAACVRTWTAPKAGSVRIIGRAMKECYRQALGSSLRVKILHNSKQAWPEQGWADVALSNLVGAMHDVVLDVAKGDIIRFVLGSSSSPDNDIIAWMPRIIYAGQESQASVGSEVRILCGSKAPYTDHNGNTWLADKFFSGGRAVRSDVEISNAFPTPADQVLYQSGRQGNDFTYVIPVPPRLYTVRLKLAETKYGWSFERPLNLTINGRQMLQNFDVCQAARASRTACEQVFRNIVPNSDGKLVLRFTGGFEPSQKTDQALIHAIEILPETRQTVRIDAGSDASFVDWNGYIWSTDGNFQGGSAIRSDAPLTSASPTLYDQALYQTARSGRSLSYSVQVSPGVYMVHLKFAELWLNKVGQRPMDIEINGRRVRENWDPGQAAGQTHMAADIRIEGITPDKDGSIVVRVTAVGANDAILQGIEIE